MTSANSKRVYVSREACEYLQCSYPTLKKYIDAGELKAIRIGRTLRITQEALDEFIASRALAVS